MTVLFSVNLSQLDLESGWLNLCRGWSLGETQKNKERLLISPCKG
jgi:hypothetical protein